MLHKAQMFDFLSCSVSYLRLLVASCQRWAQKLSAADHQGGMNASLSNDKFAFLITYYNV